MEDSTKKSRKALVMHLSLNGEVVRSFAFDQDRVRIGRDAAAEMRLSLPGVSRVHCIIEREDNSFVLTDNGSTNGTLLNGKRVRFESIESGDLITVGPFSILVFLVSTKHDHLFPQTEKHAVPTIRADAGRVNDSR